MKILNQKEQNFLFNELAPIQYENLKDGTEKDYLKFMVDSHNVKNYTPFNELLEKVKLSKKNYFNKALYDTLNLLFDSNDKKLSSIKSKLVDNHKNDLLYLLEFDIFSNNNGTIRPVYLYLVLKHLVENIETIKNYRKRKAEEFGTAYFNNTPKNGLKSKITEIKEQLNPNNPFHVTSIEDKNRLKVNNTLVTMFAEETEEANLLVILNSMFNYELYKIPFIEGEKEGLKQSFSFLNGLPTSKAEIVRSFMIKVSLPYQNKENINKSKLCRIIKGISKTFFNDIVFDENKGNYGGYKVGLSPSYLKFPTYIKTSFEKNNIYAYDKKKEYHFLFKSSLKDAIERYTNVLIEEGYEKITQNKYYKSTLKKIFKSSLLAL